MPKEISTAGFVPMAAVKRRLALLWSLFPILGHSWHVRSPPPTPSNPSFFFLALKPNDAAILCYSTLADTFIEPVLGEETKTNSMTLMSFA